MPLVPHSNQDVVAAPFGFTEPFTVAEVVATAVAVDVVTVARMAPVVKLNVDEYALVPPALLALTRQKYVVLFDKDPTCREVVVSVESSRMAGEKLEFVETCNR